MEKQYYAFWAGIYPHCQSFFYDHAHKISRGKSCRIGNIIYIVIKILYDLADCGYPDENLKKAKERCKGFISRGGTL